MDLAVFVALNCLALATAALLTRLLFPGREPPALVLANVAGFGVVVLLLLLALGSIGQLFSTAALLSLATLLLGLSVLVRQHTPPLPGDTRMMAVLKPPPASRHRDRTALAVLAGLLAVVVLDTCVLGTAFGRDDLSYHAPAIAQWLVDARLSLAPFNYHVYYPYNAEILGLWWMLPSRADGMMSLTGLYAALLYVTATIAALGSAPHGKTTAFMVAALMLVARPVSAGLSSTSGDQLGAAMVLAALAFLISGQVTQPQNLGTSDALYSGLCTGVAVGAKISFAPVAPVLLLSILLSRPRTAIACRAKRAVVFVFALLLTGAYWYGRNTALCGNPLFPAEWGPFGGPFSAHAQETTKLIWWLLPAPLDSGRWVSLLKAYVWWPEPLFLLMAIGYLAALRDFWNDRDDDRASLGLLLAVGVVTALTHPFVPFTATTNSPEHELAPSLRYAVLPFLIGILLFGRVLSPARKHSTSWWAIAVVSFAASFEGSRLATFVFASTAIAAIGVSAVSRSKRLSVPKSLLRLLVPAAFTLVALWMPFKQRLTDSRLWEFENSTRPIGAAWRALESLPKGARIAWFGPFQYYPLYGRHLQHVPVALFPDGAPYQPLHIQWRNDPTAVEWWPSRGEREPVPLLENLRKAKIEFVFVSRYNNFNWDYPLTDCWPRQQHVLLRSHEADKVFDDGYSVIWRLIPYRAGKEGDH
jgi:hypothetical protein